MTDPITRETALMHTSDYLVAVVALILANALGAALAWATLPESAPEPHYCFRADPPPCETTVRP